ncbi:glutaredoxin family protein [Halobacterium wangiae]|uniref:glutaredoxin family protein n=1 Tax=Halobacterium wangiae TaxID=2902623 RepID=UPI001E5E088E|nr:glutaredoxin domain-containing protein [Halobacterium wangiae]
MAFNPMDSSMDQEAVDDIVDAAIANNEVVLFMKGDARMPQCGFSDRAVELISQYRPDVHTVDTLQSLDEFRVALEEHSGWETIPQTFVDGEFVGGSDILAELEERGELGDELKAENAAPVEDDGLDDEIQSPF